MLVLRGLWIIILVGLMTAALAQVELEFWFEGPSEQVAFMEEAAAEYNELQDNAVINVERTPPGRERVATALAAGQGPDLLWYNHNVPWFFGVEAIHPLNEFVLDPEIGIDAERLFPAARQAVHFGGVVMAVPIFHFPGVLIYNRDIFEAHGLGDEDAPATWAEVQELAIQLTEREGDTVTQWGLVTVTLDWMLQEILLSNGGDWVNEDLTQYVTCPDCLIEGLEWWHDLVHVHEVMPMPRGVTWVGAPHLQAGHEAFIRGEAAMTGYAAEIEAGIHLAASILNENPDLNLGAVLSPLGPSSGGERTISPGYSGLHVMADAADHREGYLFIKWFFEEKALDFVRTMPGAVPSTTAALEEPALLEDPLVGRVIEDMLVAHLRNFHVFPGRLDVRAEEPGTAESVLLGRADAREAVENFLNHAERVFQLYDEDLTEFREAHEIVW